MALDLGKPTKPVSRLFYSQFTPNQQSFLVAIVKLFRIAYNEDMEKGILKQNGVHLEDHEYETVKLFLDLGYDIELIPPSKIKGLQMPDLMLQGIPWEMMVDSRATTGLPDCMAAATSGERSRKLFIEGF